MTLSFFLSGREWTNTFSHALVLGGMIFIPQMFVFFPFGKSPIIFASV